MTTMGREYRGTLNQVRSGKTCQAWNSRSPHKHDRYNMLSDRNTAANYCRNPDNTTGGPWCYTTDPALRWEYCDVKICPECKMTTMGREYRGTLNQVRSGKTCQAWNSRSPHKHDRYNMLSDRNTAANYCRNPDNTTGGPWCYTTDPAVRWEYCDVKICPGK
ncbi:plasminogen-like [Tubulanus polymorphus]|uniref:plasminogen-like n=1 Tax=Tubulanus polymorphus TaxID=672921 RepID=UPI003DA5D9A6